MPAPQPPPDDGIEAAIAAILPEDAPPGHAAHVAVRWDLPRSHTVARAYFTYGPNKNWFQITIGQAGSREVAMRLARACFMRLESGMPLEEVKKFRQDCCARIEEARRSGEPSPAKKPKAEGEAAVPEAAIAAVLPEDAPPGHQAHVAVRYNKNHNRPIAHFRYGPKKIHFMSSVRQAGSRELAMRLARACFMLFESGMRYEGVKQFRQDCYARMDEVRSGKTPRPATKKLKDCYARIAEVRSGKTPKPAKEKLKDCYARVEEVRSGKTPRPAKEKLKKDVPAERVAHVSLKYHITKDRYWFWVPPGKDAGLGTFVVGVNKAGSSKEAQRIARLCHAKFLAGSSREEVARYPDHLYASSSPGPPPVPPPPAGAEEVWPQPAPRAPHPPPPPAAARGGEATPMSRRRSRASEGCAVESPAPKPKRTRAEEVDLEVAARSSSAAAAAGSSSAREARVSKEEEKKAAALPGMGGAAAPLRYKAPSSGRFWFEYTRSDGTREFFQTTALAAGGLEAAKRIAAQCYEKFASGATRAEVEEYRAALYASAGGGGRRRSSLAVSPAAKRQRTVGPDGEKEKAAEEEAAKEDEDEEEDDGEEAAKPEPSEREAAAPPAAAAPPPPAKAATGASSASASPAAAAADPRKKTNRRPAAAEPASAPASSEAAARAGAAGSRDLTQSPTVQEASRLRAAPPLAAAPAGATAATVAGAAATPAEAAREDGVAQCFRFLEEIFFEEAEEPTGDVQPRQGELIDGGVMADELPESASSTSATGLHDSLAAPAGRPLALAPDGTERAGVAPAGAHVAVQAEDVRPTSQRTTTLSTKMAEAAVRSVAYVMFGLSVYTCLALPMPETGG